jgi:lipoprotein signal peptidase
MNDKLWDILFFFKPSRLKLIFLIEWAAFVLIELWRGRLDLPAELLVVIYPFLFFYLLACILEAISRSASPLAHPLKMVVTIRLLLIAFALLLVDQVVKTWVSTIVPNGSSFPIVEGWLHLAHKRNLSGSWLLESFEVAAAEQIITVVMLIVLVGLLLSGLVYRYYSVLYRRSLWVDLSFCTIFAGMASFLVDVTFRGFILDYISLPGLVTADLKDIYLSIGVAALIIEAIDSPHVSLKWKGWRKETDSLMNSLRNLAKFAREDVQQAWNALKKNTR